MAHSPSSAGTRIGIEAAKASQRVGDNTVRSDDQPTREDSIRAGAAGEGRAGHESASA